MFDKITKQLNGAGSDPAALEAALAELRRDREAARKAIDDLKARRRQALLADASDEEIDVIERLTDRALIRLEKLNLAEPPLRERILVAKGEKLRHVAKRRHVAVTEKAEEFFRALEVAVRLQEESIAARMDAFHEIGAQSAERIFVPTLAFYGFLTREHAGRWINETRAQLAAGAPKIASLPIGAPAQPGAAHMGPVAQTVFPGHFGSTAPPPASEIAAPTAAATPPARPQRARKSVPPPAPPVLKAERRPDDTGPLAAGEIRARIRHNNYPDGAGGPGYAGQITRYAGTAAADALKSGAVDLIAEGPAP